MNISTITPARWAPALLAAAMFAATPALAATYV